MHKVIGAYSSKGWTESVLHTDVKIPNANFLWFQAYTSIIHGADGIWFWWLHSLWETETNEILNIVDIEDPAVWANTSTMEDRFERKYFPRRYRYYLSNIARELDYLSQRGFLDQSGSTVRTKKGQFDEMGIVPEYSDYINDSKIPAPFYQELIQPLNPDPNDHFSENYGLRYTIRSNGNETVMIIANLLPLPIENMKLNFSQIDDQNIKQAVGVEFLFAFNQSVTSPEYKVVDSEINYRETINENGELLHTFFRSFSGNKDLKLSFGPLDVHILRFVSAHQSNMLHIYPNPAQNSITVLLPGNSGSTLKLFDIFGILQKSMVSGDPEIHLDCLGISSGLYILRIETDKEVYQNKIVIQ